MSGRWVRVPKPYFNAGDPGCHEHPPLYPGREFPRDEMPPRPPRLEFEWKLKEGAKERKKQ